MRKFAVPAAVLALAAVTALTGCGPQSARPETAKARARVIPPSPTGPVFSGIGVISEATGSWVTLDHEGAAEAGLAPGRNSFKTWADVIAASPGEPGARVAFKFQKLGDGWALVEMTGRT